MASKILALLAHVNNRIKFAETLSGNFWFEFELWKLHELDVRVEGLEILQIISVVRIQGGRRSEICCVCDRKYTDGRTQSRLNDREVMSREQKKPCKR